MKKILSVLICLLLVGILCVPARAETTVTFSIMPQSTAIQPGQTITFTVSVDSMEDCRSGGIVLSYDRDVFEFVSGSCLVSGAVMSDFSDGTGVFAFSQGQKLTGEVFRFTLRMKEASFGSYTVSGSASIRNGDGTLSASVSGGTVCYTCSHSYDNTCDAICNVCGASREISHSFGADWVNDRNSHWRICTVCGERAERAIHTPGPAATESTPQTCTVCGYELAPRLTSQQTTVVQSPTEEPAKAPTQEPAVAPTQAPTEEPTAAPTEKPATEPTEEPTGTTSEPLAESTPPESSGTAPDAASPAKTDPQSPNPFPWWILIPIPIAALILFLLYRRKK